MSIDERHFTFQGADGTTIHARRWSVGEPQGVLVLAHGMGEHSGRYLAGLQEVIEAGWVTYAPDHRGHGKTAEGTGGFGELGPGGFAGLVDDLAVLTRQATGEHAGLPVVLLGHSMGSFAAQYFVLNHARLIDGLALSGSAAIDRLAQVAAEGQLESLNAPFEPGRTPFDWLSTDPAQVDLYIADPLCGVSLSPESRLTMFYDVGRLMDEASWRALPRDLPVYVFSGLDDPLELVAGALTPLIERLQAAEVRLTTDLYPGKRHELLNETNRAEVVERLLAWLGTVRVREKTTA